MKVTLQNGVKVVNEIPNTTPSDGIDDAQTAVLTDVDGNGTDEIEITSWLNSGTNPGGMRAFIPANAVVVDATSFNVDFYSPVANTVVEIEKNIKPEITIPAAYLNTSIAIKVDCASVWDIPEPDAALIYRGSTDLNAKVNEATTKSMRLNYDTSRYTINKTTLFGGETYDTAQQSVNIDSWFTGLPTGIHATLLLWYYNPVYDTNTGAFLYNEKRYYDDYEIPHVVQFSGTPTQLGTFDATLKIPETTADGQRILNIKQDITLIHEDQVDNLIWNITQDGTGGGTGGSGNTGSGSGSSGSSNTNNNTNNNANTAKPGMGNNGANWSADWFMNNYLMMSAGNLAGDLAGTDSTDKTMIVKATLDNYLQIIAAEEAYNGLNDAQKAEINARLGGTTYEQLLLDARLIELWVNSGEAEKVISAPEKDSVPKTGDNTPMTALMILTVVSGIGALVTARRKRAVR